MQHTNHVLGKRTEPLHRGLHLRIIITLFVALLASIPIAPAKETLVANSSEFGRAAKTATAGDTIILKNGLWEEKRIRIHADGTADQPITLKAETPGKVILRGKSSISISGATSPKLPPEPPEEEMANGASAAKTCAA